MKIFVLRICGDSEAQAGALLAIPEDICYVSLGLILGDIATSGRAFRKNFANSQNQVMDIIIVTVINLAVAAVTHWLAKWSNDHFKCFRAASYASHPNSGSSNKEGLAIGLIPNITIIKVRHLALFSIAYVIEIVLTISWLAWIAKVLALASRSA